MTNAFRIFIFILPFSLDAQLKAEAVFVPKNCWGQRLPCAVQNESVNPLPLQLSGMRIHLDSKAIVKSTANNEANIARGTLFAKHEGEFKWHTPFGDIFCNACEVLFQREEKSIEIHSLKGEISVVRKGDDGRYNLPPGFSVRLSMVASDGRADLDFPQATPLRPIAKVWARIYQGSPEEFRNEFKEYVTSWKSAVEAASSMHRQEVDRRLASAEDEKQREHNLRQIRQREDMKLRQLFREKNNLE